MPHAWRLWVLAPRWGQGAVRVVGVGWWIGWSAIVGFAWPSCPFCLPAVRTQSWWVRLPRYTPRPLEQQYWHSMKTYVDKPTSSIGGMRPRAFTQLVLSMGGILALGVLALLAAPRVLAGHSESAGLGTPPGRADALPNARMDRPPRLVVELIAGNLRADMIAQYWEHLRPDGLVRLINDGSYSYACQQPQLLGDMPSGVANISTGAPPCVHGLVGSYWYSRLTNRREYVAGTPVVGAGGAYVSYAEAGPDRLAVPTLADAWRMAYVDAKIYALSLDADASIILGGHTCDGAFWFDAKSARMVSSRRYAHNQRDLLRDFNARWVAASVIASGWAPQQTVGQLRLNALLRTHQSEWATCMQQTLSSLQSTGCYPLPRVSGPPTEVLKFIPKGNQLLQEFATALVSTGELGRDEVPDLLMIYFSALAGINALYGPEAPQAEDALMQFDSQVAHLLDYLDREVGPGQYLVVLTSAYAVDDSPKYLAHWQLPGGVFSPAKAHYLLNAYLAARYQAQGLCVGYHGQQFYLDELKIESLGLDLSTVLAQSARLLEGMAGVKQVFTPHDLRLASGGLREVVLAANGLHGKHSGQLIVELAPGWVCDSPCSAQALSSQYTQRQGVPLVFYGWRMRRRVIEGPCSQCDIAPTLCALLHIPCSSASQGQPLTSVIAWE